LPKTKPEGWQTARIHASIAHARPHPPPNLEAPDECWHVFFGDVRVGTIAIRTGMPPGEDPWSWACGFYPGCHPRECTDGTAETFDLARADFEQAWAVFLAKRTEAGFQKWRDQQA